MIELTVTVEIELHSNRHPRTDVNREAGKPRETTKTPVK